MIDFGTAKYVPDGKVKPDHPLHKLTNPLGFGPEKSLGKEYSFSADVFLHAFFFSYFHHVEPDVNAEERTFYHKYWSVAIEMQKK